MYIKQQKLDEIDFSKNIYYNKIFYYSHIYPYYYYNIKNLKEDKKIFLFYYSQYNSPNNTFKVCKNINEECQENISLYKFLKRNDYTIYINSVYENGRFYRPLYYFIEFKKNLIESFLPGYNIITETKIYINSLTLTKNLLQNAELVNVDAYIAFKNEEITENNINNLIWQDFFDYKKLNNSNELNKYVALMVIPKDNNKTKLAIFTVKKFSNYKTNELIILKGENALIDDYYRKDFSNLNINFKPYYIEELRKRLLNKLFNMIDNFLVSFSSEEKNMKYLDSKDMDETNFILENYNHQPIYINSHYKDNKIYKKVYKPRYAFYSIINNNTIKSLKKSFLYDIDLKLNRRINTNHVLINDFLNLYIDNLGQKYYLYIKLFYGEINFFEWEYYLPDGEKYFLNISKPFNNIKNKKSIINRIINLEKNKLITGYLSSNSYFDIYLEKDDNNTDILINNFKNRKFIKKGLEYNIKFPLNHLIKLEPGVNAEVKIINENKIILLNNKNPTGIIRGNNIKIKSNNDAMIYFYLDTNLRQIKLDIKKNESIEIIIKDPSRYFWIDFGFDNFELSLNYYNQFKNWDCNTYINSYFFENFYENLKTELVKGENLYIYYHDYENTEDNFQINYINNKNIYQKNKYNLYLIKHDEQQKQKYLYINHINKEKIKYQVHFCKLEPNFINVNIFTYKKNLSIYFNDNMAEAELNIESTLSRLNFSANNDFILTYSFIDYYDIFSQNYTDWFKERIELTNLTINEIKFKNENNRLNNIVSINFNPNYKNSITKYFIIISNENNNISNFDDFSILNNPCNIFEKLINENNKVIIEEIYDIGENEFINIDINISDIFYENNNLFVVNIISQELKFDKKINFYKAEIFRKNHIKQSVILNKKNVKIIIIICFGLLLVIMFNSKKYWGKKKKNIFERYKKEELLNYDELKELN